MKKTKIFIGAAALLLGVSAFMATKASSKFAGFLTAVTAGGAVTVKANFTTVAAHGTQAYFATAGGTQTPLVTKVSHTKIAYLLP